MESGKQELLNQDSWLPPSPRTSWQAQNICIGLGGGGTSRTPQHLCLQSFYRRLPSPLPSVEVLGHLTPGHPRDPSPDSPGESRAAST